MGLFWAYSEHFLNILWAFPGPFLNIPNCILGVFGHFVEKRLGRFWLSERGVVGLTVILFVVCIHAFPTTGLSCPCPFSLCLPHALFQARR